MACSLTKALQKVRTRDRHDADALTPAWVPRAIAVRKGAAAGWNLNVTGCRSQRGLRWTFGCNSTCMIPRSGSGRREEPSSVLHRARLFSSLSGRRKSHRHHGCHAPRRRSIQYSAAEVIEPKCRGVLDRPLSLTMTAGLQDQSAGRWERSSSSLNISDQTVVAPCVGFERGGRVTSHHGPYRLWRNCSFSPGA